VIEAQRAKGALEAYMKLYKNDYVPESVWRTIYPGLFINLKNRPERTILWST